VRSRDLLGQGLWVALAGTALIVLWRQGTLVLGAGGTIGALAAYVVASRFLDAGVTIAHTAGFGLVPGVSALASDPAAFRRAARKYIGVAAAAGVVIALVGVLAAEPITVIPFGDRWAEAVPAVRVIALTGLPILVAYVAWPFLNARRQVRLLAAACLAGTATAVAVTIALVLWRPDALSTTIGTFAGSVVLAGLILFGLRDVLVPTRTSEPQGC
jgi:O-antigen/teichoic acid export membrane protein